MSKKDEIKGVSEKIEQLKSKIDWFYGDEFVLDEAPERYEEVLKMSKEIEKDLAEIKNRVAVLSKDFTK